MLIRFVPPGDGPAVERSGCRRRLPVRAQRRSKALPAAGISPRKRLRRRRCSRRGAPPAIWTIGEGRKCLYASVQRSEADKHDAGCSDHRHVYTYPFRVPRGAYLHIAAVDRVGASSVSCRPRAQAPKRASRPHHACLGLARPAATARQEPCRDASACVLAVEAHPSELPPPPGRATQR